MKLLDNANHNLIIIKYICGILEILFGLDYNNNYDTSNDIDSTNNNNSSSINNNSDSDIDNKINDISIHGNNNNNDNESNDRMKENDNNNNNINKQNILAFNNNDFINNLITILNISDNHIQYITSLLLSLIYSSHVNNKYIMIDRVIIWISNKVISEMNDSDHQQQQLSGQQHWEIALSCLLQLVHHHEIRLMLLQDNAVIYIMKVLKSLGIYKY